MAVTTLMMPRALICTLGGKPQIATFALDALLQSQIGIDRLIVVHLSTADARLERAVGRVRDEMPHYGRRAPHFQSVVVREIHTPAWGASIAPAGRAIAQIDDPAAPDAIWLTFHSLVSQLKQEGYALHLCVTGGPRLIGALALSAASFLFTSQDTCWHLYTPGATRDAAGEGVLMHVPADSGTHLVPVPVPQLGMLVPGLRQAAFLTPQAILKAQMATPDDAEMVRCRGLMQALSPAERRVVQAIARGADNQDEAAHRLHITVNTLSSHTRSILRKCRAVWVLPEGGPKNLHFLREKFGVLPDAFWVELL